jgi:hypothetical protein
MYNKRKKMEMIDHIIFLSVASITWGGMFYFVARSGL